MRVKTTGIGLALVAGAILVVAIMSFSSHSAPNSTVQTVPSENVCAVQQGSLTCTIVLSSTSKQLKTSDISTAKINGTAATISAVNLTDGKVSVEMSIPVAQVNGARLDSGGISTITLSQVVVYLSDGTTVNAAVPVQNAE